MRALRYVALFLRAFLDHYGALQLARKWDAEAAEPRKRRVAALDQLAHEVNKVRQGGYWREVEWDQIMVVALEGGRYRVDGRATNLRWTPR